MENKKQEFIIAKVRLQGDLRVLTIPSKSNIPVGTFVLIKPVEDIVKD